MLGKKDKIECDPVKLKTEIGVEPKEKRKILHAMQFKKPKVMDKLHYSRNNRSRHHIGNNRSY